MSTSDHIFQFYANYETPQERDHKNQAILITPRPLPVSIPSKPSLELGAIDNFVKKTQFANMNQTPETDKIFSFCVRQKFHRNFLRNYF